MLCLDTYALIEVNKGNPEYKGILEEEFVICEPVLAEFYYVLSRDYGEESAQEWLEALRGHEKPANLSVWIKAVKYKRKHNKENLSFFDCIGYVFAIENGYIFVTGDKQFEKKKGVRYIK